MAGGWEKTLRAELSSCSITKAPAEITITILLYPLDCFYLSTIVSSAARSIDEQLSLMTYTHTNTRSTELLDLKTENTKTEEKWVWTT